MKKANKKKASKAKRIGIGASIGAIVGILYGALIIGVIHASILIWKGLQELA